MAILGFQKPFTALSTDGQQLSIPVKDTYPIPLRSGVGSTPENTPSTSPWKETATKSSCQSPNPLVNGLRAQSFPHCGGEAEAKLTAVTEQSFFSHFLSEFQLPTEAKVGERPQLFVQAGA